MRLLAAAPIIGAFIYAKSSYHSSAWDFGKFSKPVEIAPEIPTHDITLYQFYSCPFCCKVRAYLKYSKLPFKVVEVNPLTKQELDFSTYKKVPVAIIDSQQVNDSSKIISLLESCRNTHEKCEMVLKKIDENDDCPATNRFVILGDRRKDKEREKEKEWRNWVNSKFVHTLSPNIYRTLKESYEAMDYMSYHGNFSYTMRLLAKNAGAVSMYFIGKSLQAKHNLGSDVRRALYSECNIWLNSLEGNRFNGGSSPNLADLETYGVLSAIDGLPVFKDLQENVPEMMKWYKRVKKCVETGRTN